MIRTFTLHDGVNSRYRWTIDRDFNATMAELQRMCAEANVQVQIVPSPYPMKVFLATWRIDYSATFTWDDSEAKAVELMDRIMGAAGAR